MWNQMSRFVPASTPKNFSSCSIPGWRVNKMKNEYFAHSGISIFAADRSTPRGRVTMKMVKVVFLAALAVVFSLASLFFAAPGVRAQSVERGEIRGYVYDTTHSLVPGAKVII